MKKKMKDKEKSLRNKQHFYPSKKLVSPLILFKCFCAESIAKWSIGVVHNGLKTRSLSTLSTVTPLI
jgi:hypothetical protein